MPTGTLQFEKLRYNSLFSWFCLRAPSLIGSSCRQMCTFPWLATNMRDSKGVCYGGSKDFVVTTLPNGVRVGFLGLIESEWISTLIGKIDVREPQYVTLVLALRLWLTFCIPGGRHCRRGRGRVLHTICCDVAVRYNVFRSSVVTQAGLTSFKICCLWFLRVTNRAEHRVDYVVAITHQREGNDYKLAEESRGLDLILGAHDHHIVCRAVSDVSAPVVKSGSDFRWVKMSVWGGRL